MTNKVMVTPNKQGGKNGRWQVKLPGKPQPLSNHRTQSAAADAARPLARKLEAELQIRGRKGQIVDSDSYGKDPNPPKDTKH